MKEAKRRTPAVIDLEIEALRARIVELLVERNQVLPVGSLPSEILTRIFHLAAREAYPLSRAKAIVRLTWVSRRWREVGTGYARFWNKIDSSNIQWIDQCIDRAKDVPLHVNLTLKHISTPGFAAVMAAFPQIHSLRMAAHFLLLSADSPAPVIREAPWIRPAEGLAELDLSGFVLPPSLFAGRAPMLRTLSLQSCSFGWAGVGKLTSITRLVISRPARQLPWVLLADTLKPLLQLQELFLSFVLAPNSESDSQPQTNANTPGASLALQRVSTLYIREDAIEAIVQLANGLKVPGSANLLLDFSEEEVQLANVRKVINLAMQHLGTNAISSVAILNEPGMEFSLEMARNASWPSKADHTSVQIRRASNSMEEFPDPEALLGVVGEFIQFVPVKMLLCDHRDTEMYEFAWGDSFPTFTSIETLVIVSYGVEYFLQALARHDIPHTFFSRVQTITLRPADATSIEPGHCDSVDDLRRAHNIAHINLVSRLDPPQCAMSAFDEIAPSSGCNYQQTRYHFIEW